MEPIEACQMIQRIEGAMVRIMHSNKFIIPKTLREEERRAIRPVLKALLGRTPTDQEVENARY